MQITRWDGRRKRTALVVVMILFCMCVSTACGDANDINIGEETERLEQEDIPVQNVRETGEAEMKEDTGGEVLDGENEQIVFTVEDLPEEIKNLLNYENWTDGTQAISRTEEEIKDSGMPEEFQQIITGDFSCVQGLRNEEEREDLKEHYERRESWAYMTRDMNRDGIEELCIKDSKGRIGIFFEVWGDLHMPGMIEVWSFGEHESNLLTEKDWGANDYFLNNGQMAMLFKSSDESNSYFSIGISYLSEFGTFPTIEEISIIIINDTSPSPGYVVNYEKPGIYYEIDRDEGGGRVTEQEAIAWCEDNIYPYMMSEEEWYAVP
ncbi:MAG: hypothetical protein K2P64_05300 [Lachnospiraceae bacterium]|nr:hypothetical protein [Lachnospiraceae bacterium]